MIFCSHNKHHHSAYTEQFISKLSHVDRSTFTDDSELNVESLIKNLKDVIMKKLLISWKIVMDFTVHKVIVFTDIKELFTTAKDIYVFRNENVNVVLFYIFASVSEIILIKDDNTAETIFSHSQASLITFSLFSVRNVVHTPGSSDSAGSALFFNFSTYTHAHSYIGISANLAINDINVVHRAVEESETCTVLLQEQLATLESLADLKF
ncbi:hypothetical protein BDDG_11763 [Blastomyces dermatitidis ATCC 18188]|uniref:Uncharacterized protein n=1 Tax=Ajellomyces dermatitidis (strain ATCC 18188 / CBS 674.68) TaxID=653446 RepID=A0A0J9EL72_AJEDA|nr:hypothetical protein BDDG_11763 [Blastomyces dermatitidis ATCC 18188]